MFTVIEVWHLRPEFAGRALEIMQEMDDMVEPGAHLNPGWTSHGKFYQYREHPTVLMIYRWRDEASHQLLRADEDPKLQTFYQKYCTKPREIHYAIEIPVEHED